MRLTVNGNTCERDVALLGDLLRALGIDQAKPGIAVAINQTLVPRSRWPSVRLAEGDAIEIVGAMRGG